VNPLIEYIYKTRWVEDSEGNLINPFPTSIPYDEGLALYNFIRSTKAENTLELGLAYGLSTLFLCQAHHDNGMGHHTAVDPFECTQWKSIGLLNIRKAGLDSLLRFCAAPSDEILPQFLRDGERFDFIFIDGNHRFDYALLDFFYADKLLNSGGYIMFDDMWMPAIRKVCGFILRNRNYRLTTGFFGNPVPLWERCLRFAKSVVQSPLDIHSISFSGYVLAKGVFKYCLMQKVADDKRKWDHYKSF
jgi:predicted O-methyltransferase YrrM